MNNTGWVIAGVVAVLVVLGAIWMFSTQAPATPNNTNTINMPGGTDATGGTGDASVGADTGVDADVGIGDASTRTEIHYTASGFSPANITVAPGTAVTFVNDTSGPMWVAADEHPTHTEFDGTDRTTHCSGAYTGATAFDQCQTGPTFTFLFNKAGAFGYHNHSAAQNGGTITVR